MIVVVVEIFGCENMIDWILRAKLPLLFPIEGDVVVIFRILESSSNSLPAVIVAAVAVGSPSYKMVVQKTIGKIQLYFLLEQLLAVAFPSPESGLYVAVVLPPHLDSAVDRVDVCSKEQLLPHR